MKNTSQELKKHLDEKAAVAVDSKPAIFDFKIESDQKSASSLFASGKIQCVVDDYKEQQNELFAVKNPSMVYAPDFKKKFEDYYSAMEKEFPIWQRGRWVYFPWLSKLAHILEEDDFQMVRTARNKNLINKEEQGKFYNATVGIGGLSVGNSVALAIVLQGGAKRIKLADLDRLALSNTNRIRTGVDNLGVLKVEMTAREIYEINPYAEVELFPDGLTKENIGRFFDGLDIVIDELDNLAVKYLIREQAKKHKIAVVMAADNGDNAVVDVERYDLDQNTPFFQGRMGEVSYEMLSKLDKFGIGRMITKHVGPENVTERMQQSLLEMGKTIVSWPQLGGAALINGSAVAYCVRKILNNQPIENNRALISLDEKLTPNYNSAEEIEKRRQIAESFKKIFGL
ncbi:MAG: ThiF family adenylyltransferase [Patescibacteria group bacterium]